MRITMVALAVLMIAGSAWAQEVLTSGTLLRGMAERAPAISSAECVVLYEVYASESYHEDASARMAANAARFSGTLVPPEGYQRRDLGCRIVAFDDERRVTHASPLNISGYDWGLIPRTLLHRGETISGPEDLRSGRAGNGDDQWYYFGPEATWRDAPEGSAVDASAALSVFLQCGGRYEENILHKMSHRVIGRQTLQGRDCWVVHVWGKPGKPHDLLRIWICPDLGYARLRQEKVSRDADGMPGWLTVTIWRDFVEADDGIWMAQRWESHSFPPRWIGDPPEEGEEIPDERKVPQWAWTRRSFLRHLTVNQPLSKTGIDALWPADYTWDEGPPPMPYWDDLPAEALAFFEETPPPEPDPFGAAVLEHADELSQWMMTLPAYAEEGAPGDE